MRPYLVGTFVGLWCASMLSAQPPAEPGLLPMEPAKTVPQAQPAVPHVTIETIAPASINVGQVIPWEIIVRNQGTVAAEHVLVEQPLPPGVRVVSSEPLVQMDGHRITWWFKELQPQSERKLTVKLMASDEVDLNVPVKVTVGATARLQTRVTRPKLAIQQAGPHNVLAGNVLRLNIEVANVGSGPADKVVVRNKLPQGLHHPHGKDVAMELGTLAPGEKRIITLEAEAVSPGQYVNQVQATAEGGLQASDRHDVRIGQAGLLLVQTGPLLRYLNTETTFLFEMTNPGDVPVKDVHLVDALPTEMLFVEATDGGSYDKESHSVTWKFNVVLPGETKRIGLKAVPTAAGEFKNRAVAKAEPKLDAKAESTIQVVGVAALNVELTDDQDPVATGETVVFTCRVRNQGTSPQTKVGVLALVPEGVTVVAIEGSTSHRVLGRQIIFAPLAQLDTKAEATYKIHVRHDGPGDHRFKVQVQSEQLRLPVSAEESTHVIKD